MSRQPLLDYGKLEEDPPPPAAAGTKKSRSWKRRMFKKNNTPSDQPNVSAASKKSSPPPPKRASPVPTRSEDINVPLTQSTATRPPPQQLQPPPQDVLPKQQSLRKKKAHPIMKQEAYSGPIDGDTLKPVSVTKKNEAPRQPSPTPRRRGDGKRLTRMWLSREFGRTSLHPKLARNWVVEVSPAEWDGEENQWKYRVLVQRRDLSSKVRGNDQVDTVSSFTNAFTWRSIADFSWLENALRAEYHGALMLPLLSIAIGTSDLANTEYEVDATLLRDWLGDVFNGIRGQGELMLDMGSIDLISSEAMEAFLYRNTDPLPAVDPRGSDVMGKNLLPSTSSLDLPWKDGGADKPSWKDSEDDSFVNSLFSKPFAWLPLDSMCAGTVDSAEEQQHDHNNSGQQQPLTNRLPLEMISCSSRAVGNSATLEVQDSFVEGAMHQQLNSSQLAIHSELLEAEKELVSSYRRSAMSSMEKLRVLTEEEAHIGMAWKRFAIALSNLFAFEKQVESTRIGEKEKKENMPHRKLRTRDVEDLLRVMARQKMDRSTPNLQVLDMMLGAYVADLSAVEPAISAYSHAVVHLAGLDEAVANSNRHKKKPPEDVDCVGQWPEQLRALASNPFGEVKKQFEGNSGTSLHTATTATSSADMENVGAQQKRAFEQRVLANERLLRQSVTGLCKATPLRVARMSWKYFKMESGQAARLKGAAIAMRTKVNVASAKALLEMDKRHQKRNKEDDEKELEIVQRIVNIGNHKKYSSNPQQSSVSGSESEASSEYEHKEEDDEEEKALLREKALDNARERPGLWDSKLALSIMEAVGISDAEVRVEETTRDLRLVRKHAIGLRENLSRCVESVDILKSVLLEGDHQSLLGPMNLEGSGQKKNSEGGNRIGDTRENFFKEASALFSGRWFPDEATEKRKSASPSASVLSGAGIDTSDPAGWRTVHGMNNPSKEAESYRHSIARGRCGEATVSYLSKMDEGIDFLLSRITEILDEYHIRVEGIESFVYMQCVGIQLEKHFSQQRSQALAAWEKKTDITTAINIATRKGLPLLVNELQSKLDNLSPRNVSHTTVKDTKEKHLMSKALKTELQDLANRRFLRDRETATQRVVLLMTLWSKYEEGVATKELTALSEAIEEIERTVKSGDIPEYLLE